MTGRFEKWIDCRICVATETLLPGVKMKMAKLSGTKIVGQDIDGDGQ